HGCRLRAGRHPPRGDQRRCRGLGVPRLVSASRPSRPRGDVRQLAVVSPGPRLGEHLQPRHPARRRCRVNPGALARPRTTLGLRGGGLRDVGRLGPAVSWGHVTFAPDAVPFSDYMAAALYGPNGFYASGGRARRRGASLASPELGTLFGAVVARFLLPE